VNAYEAGTVGKAMQMLFDETLAEINEMVKGWMGEKHLRNS